MSAHWMFTLGENGSSQDVPGSSKWIAGHLKDCDQLVASSIKQINNLYINGINQISEFLGLLNEMAVEERENSIIAERLLESPVKMAEIGEAESGDIIGARVETLVEYNESNSHIKGSDKHTNGPYKHSSSPEDTPDRTLGEKHNSSQKHKPSETSRSPENNYNQSPDKPNSPAKYTNFPLNINSLPLKLNDSSVIDEIRPQQRITNDQIIIPSSSPTRSTANRDSVIFSRHSQITAPTVPLNVNIINQKLIEDEHDDSLQKIQMSIRRYTDVKKQEEKKMDIKEKDETKLSVTNNNSSYLLKTPNPVLSTKTPVKTPAFVSLPKREPLNIESSAPRLNRKSFATISREKRQTSSSSTSKQPESVSPMKRNRFPSFVEDMPTTTPAKIRQVSTPSIDIPASESVAPKLPALTKPDVNESSKVTKIVKKLQELAISKSPLRLNERISLKPMNTPKLTTPAIHSIKLGNLDAKSSMSSGTPSPSAKTSPRISRLSTLSKTPKNLSTAPRFMSPTGASIAKSSSIQKLTDSSIQKSKSKFMTTTLGPNTRLSRYTPRSKQSPVKTTIQKAAVGNITSSLPLDTKRIPSLAKKSLVLPRPESKTKQKLVITTKHKKSTFGERRATSDSKHKLSQEPTSAGSTSYKRRQLGGNGVALPEAARPKSTMKLKEARTTQNIALATLSATPKKMLPALSIHKDSSSPVLPDIASEDEGGIVLKPWAEPSVLHQLVVQSKQMNPKEIFGEVSKFNIDAYEK